jgi:hypothetical protein
MRPLPPPPLRLKTSPKAGPAQAAGQLTRTLEIKKGKTTQNDDDPRIVDIPVSGDPAETAIVGLSLGLTIPGPPNTFLSARVDAAVYLPSRTDSASLQKTKARIREFIQKAIEEDVEEVDSFFKSWMNR